MNRVSLSEVFLRFSHGVKNNSEFYNRLSRRISSDKDILELVKELQVENEPPHIHFLYSIHYLLLKGYEHQLREYYPSIVDIPKKNDLLPAFKSFCFQFKDDIADTMQTKKVQTHEVRRCTTLLPGFAYLAQKNDGPWTLIEIGSSAGLNLFWDQYCYKYNDLLIGNTQSQVKLTCDIRNGTPPLNYLPNIDKRIGIDLNPLHLRDNDDRIWLQSMIWPDQTQRMELLRGAIHQNLKTYPDICQGNAIDLLPNLLETIPPYQNICIYQTISMYLFTEEDTQKFYNILKHASTKRDIYFLSLYLENPLEGKTELVLEVYKNGGRSIHHLANCHYHGKWIDWKVDL